MDPILLISVVTLMISAFLVLARPVPAIVQARSACGINRSRSAADRWIRPKQ